MLDRQRIFSLQSMGLVLILTVFGSTNGTSASAQASRVQPGPGAASAAQSKYKQLALLVGIDEYKYQANLKGAVNDVRNMKSLLVDSFAFPDDDEHIRVLTNRQASRESIIKAVKEHLIAKADSDSIVVFHYSGHGSRMRDAENGDEIDGYDETIVPYDSSHENPHPNQDITDDEVNALLRRLTDKTPNVTLVFDSCHSGTVARGSGFARTVEPDHRPPPKRAQAFAQPTRGVAQAKNDLRPTDSRYTLISGSAAQELAYELVVDGRSYGAMTWFLTEQIRRAGADATYRDVMDVVTARVSSKYRVQHPQLEGPGANQHVFSVRSQAPTPYVLAKPRSGGKVMLQAGQAQGVTAGSLYDVYQPGTKSFDADVKPVAKIRVTRVDITQSIAKITAGDAIPYGARAVERQHFWPDSDLRVHFMGLDKSKTLQEIKAELSGFKHITSVDNPSGYDLLVREHEEIVGGNRKRTIVTEGGDPTEISPRVPVADANAVSRVVNQITHWAKWFNMLGIENQATTLDVHFNLKIPAEALASSRGLTDRTVTHTLTAGDRFTTEVTNNSNQRLYIALLILSNDGSVDLVYPAGGEQEYIAPGKTWRTSLESFVPENRMSVRDVLKLVATTNPADFRFIKMNAVRGGPGLTKARGSGGNPLEELLANAAMGTTRGARLVNVGDWATIDHVMEVRRGK